MKHSVNAKKAHSDLQKALDRMLKVLKNLNDSLHVVGLKGFPVCGGYVGVGGVKYLLMNVGGSYRNFLFSPCHSSMLLSLQMLLYLRIPRGGTLRQHHKCTFFALSAFFVNFSKVNFCLSLQFMSFIVDCASDQASYVVQEWQLSLPLAEPKARALGTNKCCSRNPLTTTECDDCLSCCHL